MVAIVTSSSMRLLFLAALVGSACQSGEKPPAADRPPAASAAAKPAIDTGWNDDDIAWRAPTEGLAEARRLGRPACVVVFATWCPHCTTYRAVFSDPQIVEAARRMVMIRIDADAEPALAQRFAPDGEYVPRTFMLASDGTVRTDIRARVDQYAYFYDEDDPAQLLGALRRAAL
jgi:protein-disulfide reductase (glutathione)